MKLEKRSDGGPVEPMEEESSKEKKPVVVYIMILFIAAFLLMAWSFASHQRSNTEALGRLQTSVTAMQEVQGLQDQVIALQQELAEAQRTIESLNDENKSRQDAVINLEKQTKAMQQLYILQQQFSAKNYDACRKVIQDFETQEYAAFLPRLPDGNVTRPEDRYQQLKQAVESHTAENGEN